MKWIYIPTHSLSRHSWGGSALGVKLPGEVPVHPSWPARKRPVLHTCNMSHSFQIKLMIRASSPVEIQCVKDFFMSRPVIQKLSAHPNNHCLR